MGNLCGKQSKDNFEGQGRTLGSAPEPATRASVPSNATAPKPKVGGPPRTLGDSNRVDDPKAAAAAAAEVRDTAFTIQCEGKQTGTRAPCYPDRQTPQLRPRTQLTCPGPRQQILLRRPPKETRRAETPNKQPDAPTSRRREPPRPRSRPSHRDEKLQLAPLQARVHNYEAREFH